MSKLTDITEHKQFGEADLLPAELPSPSVANCPETLSEEAFFFARSLDLLSVIGMDGYFKRVNPMFTQTLGYSEAELLARPFMEFVHPDDRPVTLAEMEKLKKGAPTLHFENRYQTKDDSCRWLAWTASPQVEQGVIYCVARDITQQKQIEAALQQANQELERRVAERTAQLEEANAALAEREALYRTVTQHIPNGAIHIFNHDLRYLLMEGYELEKLGLDRAALVGKTIWEVLPSETCEQIEPMYRAALAGQVSIQEVPYANQIYEVHTLPVRNEQGEIFAGMVLTQNITHRKQAEAELEESRAMLQRQLAEIESIYQSAPIGLNVLDTDLRFVRINQRLAEMNGFPVEAHLGCTVRELLPEIADVAEQILRPILETGEPRLNVEIIGETPAQPGVERVWLESFLPLKEGDRVIGINTVCEEITERKRTDEALRRSEERYRTLFESMKDGFCVVEVLFDQNNQPIDYRFLEINPAFEKQSGLYQAEGKTVRQLLPNLQEYWWWTFGQVALTGEPVRFERGAEGLNGWFEVHAFRIEQPESRKVAVLFKDISDRKAIETQREQLLQREQAAREAAEGANRIKDEFLAVLSHELRTPLNPILAWAQLLQSPQVSSEQLQKGLATIERNAKQQVQLIDDLLDISRIIRGKLSLNLAAVALSEPLMAALETMRLAAEAKSIQLEVLLDPMVGRVSGDAGRLQQVVWNLLCNAIKFTPIGGRVTVQVTQVNSYAQIQVSDTGQGIEPEFLPHIFEAFRQQDSSSTRYFGGLGLGLAIVRQIVEAHGGTITATSAGEGQGATLTVQLPLMAAPSSEAPNWLADPTLDLENVRILVVDDDTDSLELIEVLLEYEGAIVTAVSSGTEVMRMLTESPFDLLISDIGMPEMNGYALIRQVRTLPPQHNRDIPAIALTAYVGETNQRQALAAGFQAHVAKPIDPQKLLEAIAIGRSYTATLLV